MPVTEPEFIRFLKQETILKHDQISEEQFTKYFVPNAVGLNVQRPNSADSFEDF